MKPCRCYILGHVPVTAPVYAQAWAAQPYFLGCFEPGGNRVEFLGDRGYLIFDPAWKPVVGNVENAIDLKKSSIWRSLFIVMPRWWCPAIIWKKLADNLNSLSTKQTKEIFLS
ncbi:MAG TPA: hypothetical protein VK851_14555 [Anaerolineales bacterium]|nr:hypothetical protein [Anaerolineales bacterium]